MRGSAVGRWLVWMPIVMVASLLYWTVALGLGGLSLMALGTLSEGTGALGLSFRATSPSTDSDSDSAGEVAPSHDGYEPIVVHLEESVEPEDVDENGDADMSVAAPDGTEADPAQVQRLIW